LTGEREAVEVVALEDEEEKEGQQQMLVDEVMDLPGDPDAEQLIQEEEEAAPPLGNLPPGLFPVLPSRVER